MGAQKYWTTCPFVNPKKAKAMKDLFLIEYQEKRGNNVGRLS